MSTLIRYDNDTFNLGDFDNWDEGLTMRAYTSDFETTTDPEDCRVWAFAICDIRDIDFVVYGNTIEGFMKWCETAANCQLYFHNLGFDGAFIMDYLENNGWRWVEDVKQVSDFTYTTLISDMNLVYCVTLYFNKYRKVTIYDSFKIIPLSIEQMAKAYDAPMLKGSIDYEEYREPGHELTDEEKAYIKNDVQIAAHALAQFIDKGLTKMTAGSNALYYYKKSVGGTEKFRKVFPELDEEADVFIRKAYRGGFTYASPNFKGEVIGNGLVFDVNSLYPSVMWGTDGQELPYGKPKWFDGVYQYDPFMPLWIACVNFRFKLKPNHVPCIQIKGNMRFKQTEYLENSDGDVTICVTNVDWELINQQYDVTSVNWIGGFKFMSSMYQFRDYVDYWTEQKIDAAREGNQGKRSIAKLMLNSLYGKFATRMDVMSRKPMLVDDVVCYVDLEPETRKPVYLPVSVFVTSHARYKTITSAQRVYDRFVYADTDSLHLVGDEIPSGLVIDDYKLGAWKLESRFTRAKFLGAKCYCEEIDGSLKVTVAGMPRNVHSQVTLDNFHTGAVYQGKLYQKHVPGGIVLVPGEMEIRER